MVSDKTRARRRANAMDLVLAFNHAQTTTNANLDGMSSEERHKRDLYAECVAEANAEAEAAQAAATKKFEDETGITKLRALDIAQNNRLIRIWNLPVNDIHRIYGPVNYCGSYDGYHTMDTIPSNDAPSYTPQQVIDAGRDFVDVQNTRGVTFSEADMERVICYIIAHAMALAFERNISINPLSMQTWGHAADRLEQLGAIKPKRTVSQPIPAPVFADDKAEAEYGYLQEALPIFTAWTEQLKRDYGYEITQTARAKVCEYMDKRNLNPLAHESYDAARRWAAVTGIFPLMPNGELMLTPDENLARRVEIGEVNLNTPEGRRYYHYELNRIEAAKAGS